jgi:hypothetical protein
MAAYGAANRGSFSKANGFLAPEVHRELARAHALTVATGRTLRRTLVQLKGRRDETAMRGRRIVQALIKSNRLLVSMRLGSARSLAGFWNGATRGRSIVKIEATRQVIRGPRARVHLRLTLRDRTVVKDSEPLLLHRGKWLLG